MADDTVKIFLELETDNEGRTFAKLERTAAKAGRDSGENFSEGFRRSLGSLARTASVVAGILGTVGGALAFRESIQGAIAQEDAINRLNSQLKLTSDFSNEASLGFQEFASQLQETTKFGDEAILNQLALAKSFGATNEQAKQIAEAATDLAASFGTDLESATRNIAKTLGGFGGELSETIPALKELTQEQLQAGEGIDLLAQRFAGAASGELNTFSGVLSQARNAFGDLLEEVGFFITQSPFIVEGVKQITDTIFGLIRGTKEAREGFDFFTDVIEPAFTFSRVLTETVIPTFELLLNVATTVFSTIETGFRSIIVAATQSASGIAQAFEAFGAETELTQNIQEFADANALAFEDAANRANESFQSILDFPLSEGLAAKNEETLEQLRAFNEQLIETNQQTTDSFANSAVQATEETSALATGLGDFFNGINVTLNSAAATAKNTAQQIGAAIQNNLARAISGGIQTIIQSVAAGQNAFDAFAKFVLSSFGDLAIQLGQTLILAGVGVESLKSLGGAAAIAAGAGLVALGAIIKSFVGGGGGGAPSGGGVASPTSTGGDNFNEFDSTNNPGGPETLEERDARANVTVNIQGDVLDSDETGLRIAQLLENSINEQGAVVRTA